MAWPWIFVRRRSRRAAKTFSSCPKAGRRQTARTAAATIRRPSFLFMADLPAGSERAEPDAEKERNPAESEVLANVELTDG